MRKVMKTKRKCQYVSPSIKRLGGIGIKTLGSNDYTVDNHHGDSCKDSGHIDDDACHQQYYGS